MSHQYQLADSSVVNSVVGGYIWGFKTVNGSSNASLNAFAQWISANSGGVSNDHTHNVIISGNTSTTGVSGADKKMPPYVAVNIWKRIS